MANKSTAKPTKKRVQHQVDDILAGNLEFRPIFNGSENITRNKTKMAYLRTYSTKDKEEVNNEIPWAPILKSTYAIPAKQDSGEISMISMHVDILPQPMRYYLCINPEHHAAPLADCPSCIIAHERKTAEEGFRLMAAIDYMDDKAIDLLNCKAETEEERRKLEKWRKILFSELDMQKLIAPDKKGEVTFDANHPSVFKRSVFYPSYTAEDAKKNPALLELVGNPNLDCSPRLTVRIWELKTPGTDGASELKNMQENCKKKGMKTTPKLDQLYVGGLGNKIMTNIWDFRTDPAIQIKTWDQFDKFLVYEAGDAQARKRFQFYLQSEFVFISPMLTINGEKGCKMRWSVKSLNVAEKVPILMQTGMSEEQSQTTQSKFAKFRQGMSESAKKAIEEGKRLERKESAEEGDLEEEVPIQDEEEVQEFTVDGTGVSETSMQVPDNINDISLEDSAESIRRKVNSKKRTGAALEVSDEPPVKKQRTSLNLKPFH